MSMIDEETQQKLTILSQQYFSQFFPTPSREFYITILINGIEYDSVKLPTRYLRDCRWDIVGSVMMKLERKYSVKSEETINFKFRPVPFAYEHSLDHEGNPMQEKSVSADERPPVNDFSGKDVADFGKEVGKDSVKQAIVWTLASVLGKGMKSVLGKIMGGK